MADTIHYIPPEKSELFGYYIQIPEKAEVQRVPISMLSPSVQKRIMRLAGYMDCSKAPYVIVVSPITMEQLSNSHKARTTMAERAEFNDTSQSSGRRSSTGTTDKWTIKDHRTYLVPVRCSKDTARTISQMSQTNNQEKPSLKNELQTLRDSLVLNLQVINMKATALGMYKNVMYLVPESNKTNISDDKIGEWEKVKRLESTEPQPEVMDCKGEEMEQKVSPKTSEPNHELNGLDCVPPRRASSLQQSHKLEVVNPWNEDIWDQPAGMTFTNGSPSSRPSTETNVQLHRMSHSEKQRKRTFSSEESTESFRKKVHLTGSSPTQDSTVEKNDFTRSPVQPRLSSGAPSAFGPQESTPSHSPSTSALDIDNEDLEGLSFSSSSSSSYNILLCAPSPLGPEESPPPLSPVTSPLNRNLADLEGLSLPPSSSSSLLFNIPLCTAPACLGSVSTCEDNMSPSYLNVKSSPSSTEHNTCPESGHGPDDMAPCTENSVIVHHLRSEHASFLDIDDTTRDEKTQRLLDRVRELDKIVEDLRQREKLS
ncbi:uncharacterized protein RB166_003421 [Leptodactylus fuscus]